MQLVAVKIQNKSETRGRGKIYLKINRKNTELWCFCRLVLHLIKHCELMLSPLFLP